MSYASLSLAYLATLRWLFVAAVALAVIPNGSVDPTFFYANCVTFGLLLALCAFIRVDNRRVKGLIGLGFSLILMICVYAGIQSMSLTDHPFANPAWSDVAALGLADRGAISVAPGETIAALPSLVVPLLALMLGLILHQDDHAARALWNRLAIMGGILALIALVRHEFFADAHLFGTRPRWDGALSGHFFNRNLTAAFFALASFATLGMVLMHVAQMRWSSIVQRLAGLQFFGERKYIYAAAGGVFFLASLIALFLTQSRAGTLLTTGILALCILVIAISHPRSQSKQGTSLRVAGPSKRWLLVAAITAACVVVFFTFGGRTIVRMDQAGFDVQRLCAARGTWAAIRDFPVFGTGFATFKDVFPIYRPADCSPVGVWSQAHNSWLEGYLGFGLPFAVFIALGSWAFVRTVVYGFRVRRRLRSIPVLTVGCMTYIALHSMVDFPIQITGIAVYFSAMVAAGFAISLAR